MTPVQISIHIFSQSPRANVPVLHVFVDNKMLDYYTSSSTLT